MNFKFIDKTNLHLIEASLVFIFSVLFFSQIKFHSSAQIHTIFEMSSFYMTSFTAVILFIRYLNKKIGMSIILASAYCGVAILHLFYAIITSSIFAVNLPTYYEALLNWTWNLSSAYIVILTFIVSIIGVIEKYSKNFFVPNPFIIMFIPLIFFLFNFILYIYIPLQMLPHTLTLIYMGLFLLSAIGFLIRNNYKNNPIEFYIMLSLLLFAISQFYMTFANEVFGVNFNLANIFKFLGYAFIFTGAVYSIYHLYKENRQKDQRVKDILNSVADGIITIDTNGKIDSCNPSVEKMFGYKSSELIGQKIDTLIKCVNGKTFKCLCENSNNELKGVKKDGKEFFIEINCGSIQGEDEVRPVLAIRDISHRKEIEKAKNEFVSVVSHELRTPLTSIRGALGLVLSEALGKLPDKVKELLNIANKNSIRLVNLINDILDIEKIRAGKIELRLEIYEIMHLIEELIPMNEEYEKTFHIKYQITDRLNNAFIKIDKDKFTQVMTNLLSNAAKFSTEGEIVEISVSRNRKSIRISITNKGCGIPKEASSKIFESFFQVDSSDTRKKGGTGLGLSICKFLVEKMQGNINFISKVNDKTTFYIEFAEVMDWQHAKSNHN